jgi:hypothetical protein
MSAVARELFELNTHFSTVVSSLDEKGDTFSGTMLPYSSVIGY